AAGPLDVAELLRQLELVAADVDRVAGRVVDEGDGDDVRRAVGADRRDPPELAAAGHVGELARGEDAHSTSSSAGMARISAATRSALPRYAGSCNTRSIVV